jgi:glycosyltransferase involved in cell wall biosynthesis
MKNLIYFCNDSHSFLHFRKDLLVSAKKKYKIDAILPKSDLNKDIEKLGIEIHEVKYYRHFSIISDLNLLYNLFKIFYKKKFDIIQTITIKPNIYGIIIAYLFNIKIRIMLITGAGPIFNKSDKLIGNLRKKIALFLFKISFKLCTKAIFQNQDDINEFVDLKLINKFKAVLILGSGVNKNYFSEQNIDPNTLNIIRKKYFLNNKVIILMVARMIKSKGVLEFMESSKLSTESNIKFILIAPKENNYFKKEKITNEEIEKYNNKNLLIINDYISDIRPFIFLSKICVLPTNYREGIPRFLIESLAYSKPLIVSKKPGCKEVVKEGINGYFLNKNCNINYLINKILSNHSHYNTLCKNSYKYFINKFESEIIVNKTIKMYEKS